MPETQLPPLHPTDADFAAIRRRGGFYVDKTVCSGTCLRRDPSALPSPPLTCRHQFLARPRRFGKTLLINTLEAWFQGLPPGHMANPEGNTEPLEGLPAGWTSPAWLWADLDAQDWHGVHGWHPVIRLDLSQLGSPDPAGTRAALRDYMEDRVWQWTARDAPWSAPWPASLLASGPERILRNLIQRLQDAYDRQPVVLVDEYDAPITEHLGTEADPTPAVNELRRFFRVLKDDEGLLYGVFVTGITRFARRHLFSAANNFRDISNRPAYGALCGFTEEEVERDMASYREALTELEPRLRDRDILADWRTRYNGYRFSELPSAPRVYNPFTLTNGLADVLAEPDLRRRAADGIWPSAWSASGHPGLIARLAADTRQVLPAGGPVSARDAQAAVGMDDLTHPNYADLMVDTGYYTWHGGGEDTPAYLNFPNLEVAESWTRDILDRGRYPSDRHAQLVPDLKVALAAGDVKGAFHQRLEAYLFHFSFHNLRSEDTFRSLLQSLLLQMGRPTQSEKSALGGRADHEIRFGNRMYVFEVKYNRSLAAARAQIRDRQYGREHLGRGLEVVAVSLNLRRNQGDIALECATDNLVELLKTRDETLPRGLRADHRCSGRGRTGRPRSHRARPAARSG